MRLSARTVFVRVSLLIAIVAALGAGALNVFQVKKKITNLQTNLTTQAITLKKTEADLSSAQTRLAGTTANLKETKAALEATSADKQKALLVAETQTKLSEKLGADLATTRQQLDGAQADLARYKAAGLQPEQILSAAKQLNELQTAVAAVRNENKTMAVELAKLRDRLRPDPVVLPAALRAKVLVYDPKWHFMVLDAGQNQGVLERGEVLVSRNGKLVAKGKVSRVQTDRCVATVVPGWELAEVMEGDLVLPAEPHS
jgi:septal ring factor EnvC (AmiA/AmiB activator)